MKKGPNDRFTCDCGGKYTRSNKYKHNGSNIHQNYLKTMKSAEIIHCECGGGYRADEKAKHESTTVHQEFLAEKKIKESTFQCDCGANTTYDKYEEHIMTKTHKAYERRHAKDLMKQFPVLCEHCLQTFPEYKLDAHIKNHEMTTLCGKRLKIKNNEKHVENCGICNQTSFVEPETEPLPEELRLDPEVHERCRKKAEELFRQYMLSK